MASPLVWLAAVPALLQDEGGDDPVQQASDMATRSIEWLTSPDGGIAVGLSILKFLVILVVARIAAAILGGLTGKALASSRLKVSSLLKDFFVNTTRKVVFIIGLVIALGALGVDIGPLVAGIGVAGFVIGFAMQETLGNFAAGVMVLLYRPYDIGDVIEAAGQLGKVDSMNLVSTVMLTPDNQRLVIPNSKIWGGVIRNVTASPTRRVDLTFGIGYGDDMDKAIAIVNSVLGSDERVLKDPAPAVGVFELADSSVNLFARPWVKSADWWGVKCDVTKKVKERFDAEGVTIPFPQRDVHLFQQPSA